MGFANFLGVISGQNSNEISEKMLFNSVIGFRGIVDGVGCSTFVQSLAKALSDRTSKRVCVVDTSILYPSQYTMLCKLSSSAIDNMKDWFTVEAPLAERIIDTNMSRVCLLGLYNRRLTDVYSSLDTVKLVENSFDKLKDLFDIILVDLSHEWSQVAMASAIQCNKIYTICDLSSHCLNNLQQSLNNLAIGAVPFSKCRDTIINKYSVKGRTGVASVINQCKLNVVATIPFSQEIYTLGTLSTPIWDSASLDDGVVQFNEAVDTVLVSMVNETPLEVIDMAEVEGFELEVMNSVMKNKTRARKKLQKTIRTPILQEASEQEKANAMSTRHKKTKQRVAQGIKDEVDDIKAEQAEDIGGFGTDFGTGDAQVDFAFDDFSNQDFGNFDVNNAPVGYDANGEPVYDIKLAVYDAEGQPIVKNGV